MFLNSIVICEECLLNPYELLLEPTLLAYPRLVSHLNFLR